MSVVTVQKHSKLGIASCVIALLTWLYLAVLIYLFFSAEGFTQALSDAIQPRSNRIADFSGLGTALVLMAFLFIVVPLGGFTIGIVCAVSGIIQRSRKKTSAVVGLAVNASIFASGLVFYVVGIFSGRQ